MCVCNRKQYSLMDRHFLYHFPPFLLPRSASSSLLPPSHALPLSYAYINAEQGMITFRMCTFDTPSKHIFIGSFIFLKCWHLWYCTHGNVIYLWSVKNSYFYHLSITISENFHFKQPKKKKPFFFICIEKHTANWKRKWRLFLYFSFLSSFR